MIRRIGAFVASVLAVYVLAALVSTQMTLNNVVALGLPVTVADRFAAALHDLAGLAPTYVPLIAISLLIAFPIMALVARFVPVPRTLGFVLAGAVALLVVHLAMYAVLGMHPLPVTRSVIGLAGQVAAGAVGGLAFAVLTRKARPPAT